MRIPFAITLLLFSFVRDCKPQTIKANFKAKIGGVAATNPCPNMDSMIGSGNFSSTCWSPLAFNGYGGQLQNTSSGAAANPLGGVSAMLRSGTILPNDQSVQVTTVGAVNGALFLAIRMDTNGNGYTWALANGTLARVLGLSGNSGAILSTSCPIPTVGSTPVLAAVGTTISCSVGGTTVSATDSAYTGGFAGIAVDQRSASNEYLSNFYAH